MNFKSALEYLRQFPSYEDLNEFDYNSKNLDLDNFRSFLSALGVDYSKIKFVHVAGSKGKGTVCSMVFDYLVKKNKKVGLYTSPHILSITERFCVDGKPISEDLFAKYVFEIREFLEQNKSFKITFFDFLTALALKYFVDEDVEYVVLEVGVGGRLDSTNVVLPKVTVLTKVEKEHTKILGETFEEIIKEKLGIMKDGIPLVVGFQSEEVRRIIDEKLKGRENVYFVDEEGDDSFNPNKAVVLKVLRLLIGDVDKNLLSDFKMLGRFDVRHIRDRIVVFDVAHTPCSIELLTKLLNQNFPDKKFVFLMSFLGDKKAKEMIKIVNNVSDDIFLTCVNSPRVMKKADFEQNLADFKDFSFVENSKLAFEELLSKTKRDQVVVVVTGSHFLVGEILSNFL